MNNHFHININPRFKDYFAKFVEQLFFLNYTLETSDNHCYSSCCHKSETNPSKDVRYFFVCIFSHHFLIIADMDNNSDEDRCSKAVEDSCSYKRFNRINTEEVHKRAQEDRDNNNKIETFPSFPVTINTSGSA